MADWKSLTDGEWVNIVNSDAVKAEGSYVHGAVCAAFKLIEARLREKNEPKTALDHFIDDVEAADIRDAARYRWLRAHGAGIKHKGGFGFEIAAAGECLDEEIDAAMKGDQP